MNPHYLWNCLCRPAAQTAFGRYPEIRNCLLGRSNSLSGAFNPIGDLYKTQIRQVAAAVGVPEAIILKAPSADLWPGQTDEAEVGFSYAEIDRILFRLVDQRLSIDEVVAQGFDRATVERVDGMVAGAEFKRQVPPIAKIGPRTAGIDYLYPRRRPRSSRG